MVPSTWDDGFALSLENEDIDSRGGATWSQRIEGPFRANLTNWQLHVRVKAIDVERFSTSRGAFISVRGTPLRNERAMGINFITSSGLLELSGTFDWIFVRLQLPQFAQDLESLTIFFVMEEGVRGQLIFDDVRIEPAGTGL
ncbi:hypothetical protein A3SI_00350 [Nitritalea halalkaliphila LW7]|uniref:Uncharacterized protein n=1 Tax=Nitritalea halalkaliphila LW7 TaxID=1189621 RepID=I5CAM2_9BACT|nr:hypothetical protein [Nitritalea halalkaliphila]EIM78874.1 hypothetical protein A3SI_00350 [Nitritalea halalkaliphila LW7]